MRSSIQEILNPISTDLRDWLKTPAKDDARDALMGALKLLEKLDLPWQFSGYIYLVLADELMLEDQPGYSDEAKEIGEIIRNSLEDWLTRTGWRFKLNKILNQYQEVTVGEFGNPRKAPVAFIGSNSSKETA